MTMQSVKEAPQARSSPPVERGEWNWMRRLAGHYEKVRRLHPADKLMILFDIDGTILDMRHMVVYLLRLFDRRHGTSYFDGLSVSDVTVHENQVGALLERSGIPRPEAERIHDWYIEERWSRAAMMNSHRPFRGVMEVIRWFQMQPGTYVGLNTGRPECVRAETLASLNELGREFKVSFCNDLLYMNPLGWEEKVEDSKAAGVRHFQEAGYRVFAFVDNEPLNLKRVSEIDDWGDILLLHADTIFESERIHLPGAAIGGRTYDITELISEDMLPRHIQLVWHGVNDKANLRQFLASDIQWCECDLRLDAGGDRVILRHDSFDETPLREGEELVTVEEVLGRIVEADGRSLKLDLKEAGVLLDRAIELPDAYGLHDSRLWFNGNVEVLGEEGFRRLSKRFPGSIVQCPVDFMYSLATGLPDMAKAVLDTFRGWGVNRLSLSWKTPHLRLLLERLQEWGWEVNVYNVPDLEAFLQAILLNPASVTSDFNFPKWHYYGRGSGENLRYHACSVSPPANTGAAVFQAG